MYRISTLNCKVCSTWCNGKIIWQQIPNQTFYVIFNIAKTLQYQTLNSKWRELIKASIYHQDQRFGAPRYCSVTITTELVENINSSEL